MDRDQNQGRENPHELRPRLRSGYHTRGIEWVGHTGSQEKTRTCLILHPMGKRGVAVMTNSEWGEPKTIATVVLDSIK